MCVCVSSEPTVRAELMEQVPNIAMFLHESQPNFPAAFSRYLVPIVVHYLTDPNNQVGTHRTPNGPQQNRDIILSNCDYWHPLPVICAYEL